jgi:hypothetical protein
MGARVRHLEALLVDGGATVENDVEVEGARAIGNGAYPPVALLDLEQPSSSARGARRVCTRAQALMKSGWSA